MNNVKKSPEISEDKTGKSQKSYCIAITSISDNSDFVKLVFGDRSKQPCQKSDCGATAAIFQACR